MNDLLKKLNTLIQAGIHDVLDDAQKIASEPLKHIPRRSLGKNIEGEVDHLRRKVNEALTYEDELVERISEIEQDIARLDSQADAAVAVGDEAKARYLLERLKRAEQRLEMTQSDLSAHRLAAQELMLRVNELDAAIADAKHAEKMTPEETTPAADVDPDADADAEIEVEVQVRTKQKSSQTSKEVVQQMQTFNEQAGKVLSDVLRDARTKINEMDALLDKQVPLDVDTSPSASEAVEQALQQEAVDDDIAARRARLAKAPPRQSEGDNDA